MLVIWLDIGSVMVDCQFERMKSSRALALAGYLCHVLRCEYGDGVRKIGPVETDDDDQVD